MRAIIIVLLGALPFILSQCMEPDDTPMVPGTEGIWVVNEGVFNQGNGTIGFLDPDYQYFDKMYEGTNGFPAGDVVQHLLPYKNFLYMVVNNSGKVEKLDADHLKSKASANYFLSPRKICIWDDTTAFVTDLYKNVIYCINPADLSLKKEIVCPGWTESIERVGDKLWIINITNEKLLGFSPLSGVFTDSLKLPKSPGDMCVDKENKIWVFCGGDSLTGSRLLRINPDNLQKETDLASSVVKEFVPRMVINKDKDELYLLHSGVYKVRINDQIMPSSRIIGPGENTYYGIGINGRNGDILLSEVRDFSSASRIVVYDRNGLLKVPHFTGGLITSSFLTK